jgi:sulfur carrier protein
MLEIELNGAAHTLAEGASLADLVASLGLSGQAVALALNRRVVPRDRWTDTRPRHADRVDVVRAIGGG